MTNTETATRVEREVVLPATAETVWSLTGAFGALADWHPVVKSCETVRIDGETCRKLVTLDGAELLEKLIASGARDYTYAIVESPLPVASYLATLTCVAEGEGCRLTWSSSFTPTDPSADAIVGSIYEAGFEALAARFPG